MKKRKFSEFVQWILSSLTYYIYLINSVLYTYDQEEMNG